MLVQVDAKKLMSCVFPGVAELFARGLFKMALIKVLLPTLLRPKHTISESFGGGALRTLLALLTK